MIHLILNILGEFNSVLIKLNINFDLNIIELEYVLDYSEISIVVCKAIVLG